MVVTMTSDSTTIRRSTIEQCACGEVVIGGECPACAEVLEDLSSSQATVYRELQSGDGLATDLVERTDLSYRSVTSVLSRLYKAGHIDRMRNPQSQVQNIYTVDGGNRDD